MLPHRHRLGSTSRRSGGPFWRIAFSECRADQWAKLTVARRASEFVAPQLRKVQLPTLVQCSPLVQSLQLCWALEPNAIEVEFRASGFAVSFEPYAVEVEFRASGFAVSVEPCAVEVEFRASVFAVSFECRPLECRPFECWPLKCGPFESCSSWPGRRQIDHRPIEFARSTREHRTCS